MTVCTQVYITTTEYDADSTAWLNRINTLHHCRSSQTPGRLDNQLHTLSKPAHCLDQLLISNGQDVGHFVLNDGKWQPANRRRQSTIGNRFGRCDGHDLA